MRYRLKQFVVIPDGDGEYVLPEGWEPVGAESVTQFDEGKLRVFAVRKDEDADTEA